jgi:predicted ArsR family transcriptional regulator
MTYDTDAEETSDLTLEPGASGEVARLDVLKALGDNTRYAIYLELVRAPSPLATSDIADSLGLHANTVRPHLERMRDVGLLAVHTASTGGVGRPQHRYAVSPSAPALGLEPPLFPTLARMLLRMAVDVGADGADAEDAGRTQGAEDATPHEGGDAAIALFTDLDRLGFDPQVAIDEEADSGSELTLSFGHCPFSDLAEANPDVVCGLHRGMVAGFVDKLGGCAVAEFRTLVDRNACQVDLVDV